MFAILWIGKFILRLIGVVLIWTTGVLVIGWIGVTAYQHWSSNLFKDWQLTRIPASLHISGMSYSNEVSAVSESGATIQTGLAVYDLPEDVSSRISRLGLEFFGPPVPHSSWGDWKATPVMFDRYWVDDILRYEGWTDSQFDAQWKYLMGMENYLDLYGGQIENIPIDLVDRVNEAIRATGGYYAYGKGGSILIVPPGARQAFLLYRN